MIITEKKKIKIDHTCKDSPVYLTWINSLGGYSYWLFFKYQKETSSTKLENKYVKDTSDLENSIGAIDITGKGNSPNMDIGAKIKAEDIPGIRGLYESPKVLMLMNPFTWPTDGDGNNPLPKWQRVIVKNGSLIFFETRKAFYDVKLSLIQTPRNTQKE